MIELTHVGEELLAKMINGSNAVKNHFNNLLMEHNPAISIKTGEMCADHDVRLRYVNNAFNFDGFHKLDVALFHKPSEICVGMELKLGFDRLEGKAFQERFLMGCDISDHKNDRILRIKGKMISILEGKLPQDCNHSNILIIDHQGDPYHLLPCWFLVIRKKIYEKWHFSGKPDLSENCMTLCFEDIVQKYGGREDFNELVSTIVCGDYYKVWEIEGV